MKSSSSKNMNISCIKRHHLSNSNAFDTEINVIIESCRQRGFWGFLKKTGGGIFHLSNGNSRRPWSKG